MSRENVEEVKYLKRTMIKMGERDDSAGTGKYIRQASGG